MNYRNRDLLSALAGEYVLGTLHGQARTRFEKLMKELPDAAQAVNSWQSRLEDLNATVDPVKPHSRVWDRIEGSLFTDDSATDKSFGIRFWKWCALCSSALSVLLAAILLQPILNPEQVVKSTEQYVSVFQDDDQKAVWSVVLSPESGLLNVTAQNVPAKTDNEDYQLWLLRPGDQSPVSLGLLPSQGSRKLIVQSLAFSEAAGIAVSLEPKGGSSTGLPTGPVLYVSQLLKQG